MAEKKEEKNVRKVSKIKIKKKLWYKIIAPKIFANREVGESYLAESETAIGRIVKVNLKELTGNIKDQNNYVVFQINKVTGSNLNTALMGYELNAVGIRRAVRKNANRLDDYFALKTKGGRPVVIKTLMVTVNKIQRSKGVLLRKKLGEILQEEVSKSDFETLVSNLVGQKIQSVTRKRLNKIYPLRDLSIRFLRVQEKGLLQEEIIVQSPEEEKPLQPGASEVKTEEGPEEV
ncbi:MAG: hypothetical protein WCV90_03630 [Candidatus Woesearchaeota archaeon]|jgi:ribosomal protein S3AE